MLQRMLLILVSLSLFILVGCQVTAHVEAPGISVDYEGTLDENSGQPDDGSGTSLGRGTVTMENGDTLEGEFFDTDGDGKPDKFKPDAGQSGSGAYGETNGTDWYDVDLNRVNQPKPVQPIGLNLR